MYFFIALLSIIPKNMISYLMGRFAELRWTEKLRPSILKAFVRMFRIDMSEAEMPLQNYKTMQEVFTRRLKLGARPISSAVVSPADGILISRSVLANNMTVQAKGLVYEVDELVFGPPPPPKNVQALRATPTFGWCSTVYLAPHDYHRVHSPISGRLLSIRYVPGNLWPVMPGLVQRFPRLFLINERMIFDIETDCGMVHVVMVGATNVGKMSTPFLPNFFTNDAPYQYKIGVVNEYPIESQPMLSAGDELGTFNLGSTVVVVFEASCLAVHRIKAVEVDLKVQLGQSLLAP